MKIGYDGKRAVNNMTGLGNYSRLVIEEVGKRFLHYRNLSKEKESETPATASSRKAPIEFGMHTSTYRKAELPDWQLLVYTPKMHRNPRLEPLRRLYNVEFRFPPAQGLSGSMWRSFGISNNLKADGIDIYHGLSNELPLNIRSAGVKSIVTIHDVIYRRLPYCYKPIDRLIYDFKYGHSARNADKIIAVSQRTKADVMEFYDIPEEKIEVVYQGCDDIFRQEYNGAELKEAAARLQLPQEYIVQVGTVERRKNLELTLRALSVLPRKIKLVVVGRDHGGYKKRMIRLAAELGVGSRVIWLEGVDFHDLPLIYTQAIAAVYPSRYEGFGIPVIEALECNTPVVGATGSCLEEAGGEGGIYVSPDDPREAAEALSALIADQELRRGKTSAGKIHVSKFDNTRMANHIIDIYRGLVDG
ncbi:MAG: glycosyltransferase family 4 protein [Muribaculum sp.]|nr:glycosyltransferase family 4 protein [Muribaculum sp.]